MPEKKRKRKVKRIFTDEERPFEAFLDGEGIDIIKEVHEVLVI
jgi:hypothetical protein